ncbi:MAG: RNA polymerase sigma factor [Bacteroidota bacterium]
MSQIDTALLKRCQKRDQRAQSELYRLCFVFLMPICYRYAGSEDDAMEFLNMGFYKVISNLKKYSPKIPFEAWCKRVVINTILDELRKKKRYRKHVSSSDELLEFQSNEPMIDPEIDQETSADEIYEDIRHLPRTTASVFNLYAIDGYKHKEIAKKLGISEGTSKWHYSEAKKRLKAKILARRQGNRKSEEEEQPLNSEKKKQEEPINESRRTGLMGQLLRR